MESKHDKWVRLSKNRKAKIKDNLRLIVNLNNKSNYEYSQEEVDKLFDDIEAEVKEARKFFNGYKKFSLTDD